MSKTPPIDEPNPYAPPQMEYRLPDAESLDLATAKLVREFRAQVLALGVLWILVSVLVIGVGIALAKITYDGGSNARFAAKLELIVPLVFCICGLIWGAAGIGTLCKQMWGVRLGLAVTYLTVIANLLYFNVCGLLIAGAAILQGHRVLGFASKIRKAGLTLTQSP